MYKKAQAAMEFLMTYGWAILVVLVAIGALAYFGVLNPSRFLPESCTIGPGLSCDDFQVNTVGGATVLLRNGMGVQLNSVSVAIGADDGSCGTTSWSGGDVLTCTWSTGTLTEGTAGSRFKDDLTVTYTEEGSTLEHAKAGELITKRE